MMPHICHLTILNPTVHTRIFYKLALSQVNMGYRVSIIGRDDSRDSYQKSGVDIYPIKPFYRLSWQRVWAQVRILRMAVKMKVDIYTLHTPELLWLGLFLKWKTGAKIIYDVHEDYQANLQAANHYPKWVKGRLAKAVRWLEKRAARKIDAVSYAEHIYNGILGLPTHKTFFLTNKFTTRAIQGKSTLTLPDQPYMLYTGTLAREWGIEKTLKLWQEINQVNPLLLIIAGFTHQETQIKEIETFVNKSGKQAYFQLIGGREYVPYRDIINLIAHCEFGTALYEVSPNIRGKIPTKFYEYMAFDKPLIYTKDQIWDEFNEKNQLGVSYHPDLKAEDILTKTQALKQNQTSHQVENYRWESEEKELKKMLDSVISGE